MRKNRTFYTLLTLLTMALILFSGCQVSNLGEIEGQALEIERVEGAETSRPVKIVTVYETRTFYRVTAYEVNDIMNRAHAGGYTKYYNRDGFKGTLRSTDCDKSIGPVSIGGGYYNFTTKITYKGTVTSPVILTKSVTVYEKRTFYRVTAYEVNNIMNRAHAGGYTTYYNKDGYTGTLNSTDCDKSIGPVSIGGGYYDFSTTITYKGTVTKKM